MKLRNSLTSLSIALMMVMAFTFSFSADAQDAPKLNDAQIAHAAVTANQIDVDYGKLALKKTKNEQARKFAQTMINDHENIIKTATALAKKLGVTPEDNDLSKSLVKGAKETTKKLKKLKGKAFAKAYIDNEVAYHDAVVGAVKSVLIPQTQNEELKNTLKSVLPLLEQHLQMAKNFQAEIEK